MNPVFRKLNLKAHDPILVHNHPESFDAAVQEQREETRVHLEPESDEYSFMLGFAEQSGDLLQLIDLMARRLEGDGLLWIAYPKKTSKKYTSDISRDADVWRGLGDHGYEPVRQVAIDEDWSALRFRKVEYIRTMKRSNRMAMSKEGKKRTS